MSIHYSPPHVVHEAYARSCVGKGNIEALWTKLSHEVYVIERRLSNMEMAQVCEYATLTRLTEKGEVIRINATALYDPVYAGRMVDDLFIDYVAALDYDAEPHSWWLKVELVDAGERIRFPALPSKVNVKEGLDMGELRELYSYDGFGFKLRDEKWGRQ